jgi:hypothetical protein
MNKKLLTIILITISLVVGLFLFPRFYFNHLEYQNRQIFNLIEEARTKTNDSIEQRSGRVGGEKTPEEYTKLTIDVNNGLKQVESQVNKHESILKTQNLISFLLPAKYKGYLKLKNEVFDKYYTSLRKFKTLKDYESWIYDVFSRKDKFTQGMRDVGDKTITINDAQKLIDDYEYVRLDVEDYFHRGYISEEFHKAMIADIDANRRLYRLFKDLVDEKIDTKEFNDKLESINTNYASSTMIDMFGKSYDEVTTVKQAEWSSLYNQADELTFDTLDFYEKNQLAYDPLSLIISKFNNKYPKNLTLKNSQTENPDSFKTDLNGDGREETLVFKSTGDELNSSAYLFAYDENGNEIARLPENMPLKMPFSNSAKTYSPDTTMKSKLISYDFIAGPHSSETMFFGMFELKDGSGMTIMPVCLIEFPKKASDCLFWSGEVGDLVVDDLDDDGILEVIELVDEYPDEGAVTSEETKAVDEVFKDVDQNTSDTMMDILKREKGGRGSKVVWGVYKYNGDFFEKQLASRYEKYYKLVTIELKNVYQKIIRRSEMSKSSLEYNESMKAFWTHSEE